MRTSQVYDLKGSYVKAVELPFDFSKIDKTWEKYDITTAPALVRDNHGKVYDDKKFKGYFQKGLYRKLLNRNYVVLPNEECDLIVNDAIKKHGKEFGLYIHKTYDAYDGDAQYWEIRSKKVLKIPDSYRNNDNVQLGLIVRNSVGCNVSFGIDLFTFCQWCSNGAIRKGADLMNLKVKHYGKNSLELMSRGLYDRMRFAIDEGIDLVKEYERAARLLLRQKAAEEIARKVSWKYLPEYIEVDKKTREVKLTEHKTTFWEAFNDVTHEVWKADISFLTKTDMTNHLHRVMRNELEVAPIAR